MVHMSQSTYNSVRQRPETCPHKLHAVITAKITIDFYKSW